MYLLTPQELMKLNKDISETIDYARHKLSQKSIYSVDHTTQSVYDVWEQLERTNQNLQAIVIEMINRPIATKVDFS
jgi:hypothetical protein